MDGWMDANNILHELNVSLSADDALLYARPVSKPPSSTSLSCSTLLLQTHQELSRTHFQFVKDDLKLFWKVSGFSFRKETNKGPTLPKANVASKTLQSTLNQKHLLT